eukprot:9643682-Ditylum_brightwellii.AAC.1
MFDYFKIPTSPDSAVSTPKDGKELVYDLYDDIFLSGNYDSVEDGYDDVSDNGDDGADKHLTHLSQTGVVV